MVKSKCAGTGKVGALLPLQGLFLAFTSSRWLDVWEGFREVLSRGRNEYRGLGSPFPTCSFLCVCEGMCGFSETRQKNWPSLLFHWEEWVSETKICIVTLSFVSFVNVLSIQVRLHLAVNLQWMFKHQLLWNNTHTHPVSLWDCLHYAAGILILPWILQMWRWNALDTWALKAF